MTARVASTMARTKTSNFLPPSIFLASIRRCRVIGVCRANCPTAASFIRPRKIDWGHDVLTAIEQRYTAASLIGDSAIVHGVSLQLVGEEKVATQLQDLVSLQEAVLNSCAVNDQVPSDLAVHLPSLRALDLSSCLISKWSTVVAICKQLPALSSLIIR